jgi:hypothetical protein
MTKPITRKWLIKFNAGKDCRGQDTDTSILIDIAHAALEWRDYCHAKEMLDAILSGEGPKKGQQ